MPTAILETSLTIVYDTDDEGNNSREALELLETLGSIIDHTPFQPQYINLNKPLPYEHVVTSIDNRDITMTKINLGNGDWVHVDPCDLFQNTLANAGMSQDQFNAVIKYLDFAHGSIVECGHPADQDFDIPSDQSNLACGLEWILQGLKQPGYEFT